MCYEKTSIAIEFYGLKIPIEDSKKLSYIINNLSESDRYKMLVDPRGRYKGGIRLIENEVLKILNTIGILNEVYVIVISTENNEYILLGKLLQYNESIYGHGDMNLTANPTLDDDMLENMKKVHSVLEIDNAFESYEIMYKIYHLRA